jgi:hypothetical protein
VLLLSPWFSRFDFGVAKQVGIGGSRNVEVRFDLLNLFDNPLQPAGAIGPRGGWNIATIFKPASPYTGAGNALRSGRPNRTVDDSIELVVRRPAGWSLLEPSSRSVATDSSYRLHHATSRVGGHRGSRGFRCPIARSPLRPAIPDRERTCTRSGVDFVALDASGS